MIVPCRVSPKINPCLIDPSGLRPTPVVAVLPADPPSVSAFTGITNAPRTAASEAAGAVVGDDFERSEENRRVG